MGLLIGGEVGWCHASSGTAGCAKDGSSRAAGAVPAPGGGTAPTCMPVIIYTKDQTLAHIRSIRMRTANCCLSMTSSPVAALLCAAPQLLFQLKADMELPKRDILLEPLT